MPDGKVHYVIFLGVPGAGKGTQVARLVAVTGLPHVSTGNLFRMHLRQKTELGLLAEAIMNRGDLVPDQVTVDMVEDRLGQADCRRGALLDGFPRNPAQARSMTELAARVDAAVRAVFLDLDDAACRERITGRRQCRDCGAVFHIRYSPPRTTGKCDRCEGDLYQRDDDTEATVHRRIEAYRSETEPLVDLYDGQGILMRLSALGTPDAVEHRIRQALPAALLEGTA